jgi:hypothetical protein
VGGVARVAHQHRRHVFGRQDGVGEPGGDGVARHAVELGRFLVLDEDEAAHVVDVHDAEAAVRAGAGEDDGDRFFSLFAGERAEEAVDRHVELLVGEAVDQRESTLFHDHLLAGRQEVDRVGAEFGRFVDADERHGGEPGEQFVHQALEVGGEVLDDDEGHAGVGGHGFEEALQGFQAAGGGADADDIEGGKIRRNARGQGR